MTDTSLTDEEIATALKVCAEATPGPWEYDAAEVRSRCSPFYAIVVDADDGVQREEDGKFLVTARALFPRILRDLQLCRAEVRRLQGIEYDYMGEEI